MKGLSIYDSNCVEWRLMKLNLHDGGELEDQSSAGGLTQLNSAQLNPVQREH